MPGGLMQLIAYGAQDMYLTGKPDVTFFKMVYRRYTNFSMEYIRQPFQTIPNFTPNIPLTVQCKIDRNADLMYDTYLVFDLPALFSNKDEPVGWTENPGNDLIYSAEIICGGARLDIRYGMWMTIWNELTLTDSKLKSYHEMIGNTIFNKYSGTIYLDETNTLVIPSKRLYIPLGFWFCNNPGLAIPLVALQYTEIFIKIIFNPLNNIFRIGNPLVSPEYLFSGNPGSDFNKNLAEELIDKPLIINGKPSKYTFDTGNIFNKYTQGWIQNTHLLVNYIYLSEDERTRFAASSHEYLFTQTQRKPFQGLTSGPNTLDISTINHTVKEFVWVLQDPDVSYNNDWSNFTLIHDIDKKLDLGSYQYIKTLDDNSLMSQFNSINEEGVLNKLGNNSVKKFLQNLYYNINAESLQYPEKINQSFNNYIDIMKDAYLQFNGNPRFGVQEKEFFSSLQKFKHHTNIGLPGTYVYSFSLYPEDEKPTGTCNMSRLNSSHLILNIVDQSIIKKYNIYLFATNYNIFRIAAGIGGPVFSS
jgi:hypothetical protein